MLKRLVLGDALRGCVEPTYGGTAVRRLSR